MPIFFCKYTKIVTTSCSCTKKSDPTGSDFWYRGLKRLQLCEVEVAPQHLDVVAIVDLQHDTTGL